ncbi:olfactory receptor 14J1-like [Cinclus cinclus]|uniref:olfactory receptor 14J1-like n=1 Tax=Cinclus cinclus TaxID=127875 RepID=UPI002E0E229B
MYKTESGADDLEVLDEFLKATPGSLIPQLQPVLELFLQDDGPGCVILVNLDTDDPSQWEGERGGVRGTPNIQGIPPNSRPPTPRVICVHISCHNAVVAVIFSKPIKSLLTIMCYDRYVSICKPLHYGTLLGSRACAHMAAAAWASAFLYSLLHTANTFSLPLCQGNALGQFFCEIPQILKLSCSHSYLRELGLLGLSGCLAFGCFVFIVFSYVQIFRAVLRIPSEHGRHKAFSTCLPHLAVVSLFITTATFSYLKPPSISSPSLDLALSVLYSVMPPALNPLIYSLRNQELKDALRKLQQDLCPQCKSRHRN